MKPVSKSPRFFAGVVCSEACTEGSETSNSGTDHDRDRGRLNRNGIQGLFETDKQASRKLSGHSPQSTNLR